MFSIHDEQKVKELLASNGEPAFRYNQIERAIYKELKTNFDDFTTISKPLRELLKQNCFFQSLTTELCSLCWHQVTANLSKTIRLELD